MKTQPAVANLHPLPPSPLLGQHACALLCSGPQDCGVRVPPASLKQLFLLRTLSFLLLLTQLQQLECFLEADASAARCCSHKSFPVPVLLVIKWAVCSLFSMLAGSTAHTHTHWHHLRLKTLRGKRRIDHRECNIGPQACVSLPPSPPGCCQVQPAELLRPMFIP